MKVKVRICLALAACLLLALTGCGSKQAVYVQSVESLSGLGALTAGDRFPGMVVSESVTEIHKDTDKTVSELLVKEGEDVTAGQALFVYDSDQLQLALDKQLLELEQLKANIESFKEQIEQLKKDEAYAWGSDKLQYTIQIQSLQVDLKEAELNLQAKEKTVAQSQALLENTTVTSPVDGRVTSISTNGQDPYGNPQAYITIQQAGSFRIKATMGELQRGSIMEGVRIRIVSRTDENAVWYGTVTLVDYESPSQGNENDMYFGTNVDVMTSSSKYPFYIQPDSVEGLLLGQHVYVEVDMGESEESAYPLLSAAFLCYDEDGSTYVWAEKNGKLTRRNVVLGDYDMMTDSFRVLEGLTGDDYIAFPNPELCVEGARTTRTQPEPEVLPESGVE